MRHTSTRVLVFGAGWLLVFVGALSLAGCGGGGSSSQKASPTTAPQAKSATAATAVSPGPAAQASSSTSAIDVCALLTKAEVAAAIGTAVLDPKPQQFPNYASCDFNDPTAPGLRLVTASVVTGSSTGDAKDAFDMSKRNANDPQTVAGLGQDAFWDDVLGTLNVVQDKYEVSVDVAPIDKTDRLGAAKTLAAKVLAGLH